MNLALFDFDGTITKKDSFIDFIEYAVGKNKMLKSLPRLLPVLSGYKLGVIPNYKAKEQVLTHFFRGWHLEEFLYLSEGYSISKLPSIVKHSALEMLRHHKKHGDKVVIVSASIESWLLKWCEIHEAELIATKLGVKDGRLTGKLGGTNCYGEEKVKRIVERFDLEAYPHIFAYGDTPGDKPMLSLAHHSFYRKFN